jgi:hypothetical protein
MGKEESAGNSLEAGKSRGSFSGKLGYVLAVAGSAVGLGNIWRFPYLAAKYGGGIFLLVYLVLMLTFGYALIVSETGGSLPGIWKEFSISVRRLDKCRDSHVDCTLLQRDWGMGVKIFV